MSYRGGRAVQPPSSTNPRGVNAMGPRNTQKQKGTAVITIDELDRIRRQVVETKADSYETQRNMARQELQQTSKARVSNWSNTMEAQRMKREEDRIKKLEDAEVSGHTRIETTYGSYWSIYCFEDCQIACSVYLLLPMNK